MTNLFLQASASGGISGYLIGFLLIGIFIYFVFIKKEKPKLDLGLPITSLYQSIFDKHRILDYHENIFLIKSIKYALNNEIFDYNEIDIEPSFPEFVHSLNHQDLIQSSYDNDRSITEIVKEIVNKKGEDNFNDYMINEIYDTLNKFRTESIEYQDKRGFCMNYLKEIGLILEEDFAVEGETITANRTLLNDSIAFKHGGTKARLINHKFSKGESDSEYFEQILIKITRENTSYLEIHRNKIFSTINHTIKPDKITLDTETHELINRISYAINKQISNSIPKISPKPNFLSISCDFQIEEWLNTRDSLQLLIDKYHKLLEAYLNKDNNTLVNMLCFFERGNYLLSADTISLVNSISDFKSEIMESINEMSHLISDKIEDVQDDMSSKLADVKSSTDAAALAATVAAVQSTRGIRKLKQK